MANTTSDPTTEEGKRNIQGLILRGYTHPYSVHMLFRFNDFTGVPAFISGLMPYLRTAETWEVKPDYMLNIGLTWGGVKIVESDLDSSQFPGSFIVGPACPINSSPLANPQFTLNDTGPSDPAKWWGNQLPASQPSHNFDTSDVHCVVHAYAMTEDFLGTIMQYIATAVSAGGTSIQELFPLKNYSSAASNGGRLFQSQLGKDIIQFGYKDGIDEPDLVPVIPENDPSNLSYFLIGYDPNCNIKYGVPPFPTTGPEGAFAMDGCYNALRILSQDSASFEKLLDDNAKAIAKIIPPQPNNKFPTQEAYAREWLAAKLNGRWRDGTPLTVSPYTEDSMQAENTSFMYNNPAVNEPDMAGLKCPFSAHTRVTNPRDEGVNSNVTPVTRLIRRGVPYGPTFDVATPDADRGLIGLFLCGDFSTQFEKLCGWMNFNNFSPVYTGWRQNTQDVLTGNRTARPGAASIDPSFTIPLVPYNGGPANYKIDKVPQLVSTVGTAYCLLPSRATLQYIANGKQPPIAQ